MNDSALFSATVHNDPVTIAHTTAEEVPLLAEPVSGEAEHFLAGWSLIPFHYGHGMDAQALGWDLLWARAWITSNVVAVDRGIGVVRTRSGGRYWLSVRDRLEFDPELRVRVRGALHKRGFENVRPLRLANIANSAVGLMRYGIADLRACSKSDTKEVRCSPSPM